MSRVLITGGSGFIGSHTSILLLNAGFDIVILDSFANSFERSMERVKKISELDTESAKDRINLIRADIRDESKLSYVFETANKEGQPIDAVIHFAGLKSVEESIKNPLKYWDVNVHGTRCLLSTMKTYDCKKLIFSSSATIYGVPSVLPIKEDSQIKPINPYANTKAAVENMLEDMAIQDNNWRIACLRYFNPVGAHPSGLLGENPIGIPNNLFPIITQVASGKLKHLKVYGDDWPTPDGTCIRDYVHVMDLANGHLKALELLLISDSSFHTLNLGSSKGYSVLEVINTFESIIGKSIPYKITPRRIGDVGITYADSTKAKILLDWESNNTLYEMCKDSWNWQFNNPKGLHHEGS